MKHRLPLSLLVALAVALASVGPALGQTADPTLAKLPPDDLTDPPPLFMFEQYPPSVSDNVVLQWGTRSCCRRSGRCPRGRR
jgi:hypothetical protein